MLSCERRRLHLWPVLAAFLAFFGFKLGLAQVMDGRLEVHVRDPAGRAVRAQVALAGRNPKFTAAEEADARGRAILRRLASSSRRGGCCSTHAACSMTSS